MGKGKKREGDRNNKRHGRKCGEAVTRAQGLLPRQALERLQTKKEKRDGKGGEESTR